MSEKEASLIAMQAEVNKLTADRKKAMDAGDNAAAESLLGEITKLYKLMNETEAAMRQNIGVIGVIGVRSSLVDPAFGYPDVQDYNNERDYELYFIKKNKLEAR